MTGNEPVERVRVVLAGSSPDPGGVVLARALRDAGTEVVHSDRAQTVEQLVENVVQEDADAVGLIGADPATTARLAGRLADRGAGDVVVLPAGADPGEVVRGLRNSLGRPGPLAG